MRVSASDYGAAPPSAQRRQHSTQRVANAACHSLRALSLIFWLTLPGCIYRSKIHRKDFKLPQRYSRGEQSKPQKAATKGPWWGIFADPQLDRLARLALADNLDIEQARARLAQAEAQLTAARSGWFPKLNGNGNLGRSKQIFSQDFVVERDNINLSLGASYEFDLWGKTRYAYKSAEHRLSAAKYDIRTAKITVTAQLAESYYLVVASRAQLRLLDRTIEGRQRQLQLVERRYQAGVVSAVDLYQAQGNLAAARANRATFVQRLKNAEHALAVLVGRYPGRIRSGALERLPTQIRQLPLAAPSQLLLRRPDLRASFDRLRSTDAQVGVALAAHFPSISFQANIGQSFRPDGLFWSVLGGLTAPLFQGGAINAEYQRSKAVLRENIAVFKATLLNAVREVEDAVVSGQQLLVRVKHLEERVAATQGALRLSTDQYAQGLLNYLNVLASEQSYYAARVDLIAARRELVSARIQLARALGGSWSPDNSRDRPRRASNAIQTASKTVHTPPASGPETESSHVNRN